MCIRDSLSAVIRYDETKEQGENADGDNLYVDTSSTNINDGVILTTSPSGGDPAWNVFTGLGLFDATFILSPTLEEHTTYIYREHLCGIDLFQNTPGYEGNTKVIFHYYDESFKGNIITKDFINGYNAGPYMNETVSAMNMSTNELRPHDHISSAAGMIYNDMPCGTDSIAFGGWKK